MKIPEYQFPETPCEFKVTILREFATGMEPCNEAKRIVDYCRVNILTGPYFNPDVECSYVLIMDTRRVIRGHYLMSTGTLDAVMVHPREVFKTAIVTSASAIVLVHNHPSGDPTPSQADIRVTRDLIRAGALLQIPLLDHVVIGNPNHVSIRELGYFYE